MHLLLEVLPVAVEASGGEPLLGVQQGVLEDGDRLGIDSDSDEAGLGHLKAVAKQREAGHIGGGMDRVALGLLPGILVEPGHALYRRLCRALGGPLPLDGRRDDPHPQGLGEDEGITDLGIGIGPELVAIDEAGDREPVGGNIGDDGVAAGDDGAGLLGLVLSALEDLGEDLDVERIGEADNVEADRRLSPHGPDVTEGIGRGHLAEGIGVIDHRGEEIDGLEKETILLSIELVDQCIVALLKAAEQLVRVHRSEAGEDLIEQGGRKLCSTAGGLGQGGEFDLFHAVSKPLFV